MRLEHYSSARLAEQARAIFAAHLISKGVRS
jgi:hypothetical protein